MELDREKRARRVAHAFVRAVVRVGEPGVPAGGQGRRVDRVAVVLRGDVAAARAFFQAGLVVAAMAELELVGARARGEREQLVAEADPQYRLAALEDLLQLADRGPVSRGV